MTLPVRLAALTATLALLAGCPTPTVTPADAGSPEDAGSSGGDAGMPPADAGAGDAGSSADAGSDAGVDAGSQNVLVGTRFLRYRFDTGDLSVPDDAGIEIYSTLDGGLTALTVERTGPGAFRALDAPMGDTFFVKVGTRYVVTRARTLDLDEWMLGRPDVARTTAGALALTLSLQSVSPEESTFRLLSTNTGGYGYVYLDAFSADGGTALDKEPGSYSSIVGPNELIDAAKGDRARVMQFVTRDDGGFSYSTVATSAELVPFSFAPDASTPLTGTMAAAPQVAASFDVRQEEFAALLPAVHPQSTAAFGSVYINPVVRGLNPGWIGYPGELLTLELPTGGANATYAVRYGDPFPSTWGRIGCINLLVRTPTRLPGTTAGGVLGGLFDCAELATFTGRPIRPRLSPVTALLVDGVAATTSRTLTTATPVVTWELPTVGTPDFYLVRVSRLEAVGNRTNRISVASFYTPRRTLRIPRGVLASGVPYALQVTAVLSLQPAVDIERAPFKYFVSYEYGLADAVSGVLTAP